MDNPARDALKIALDLEKKGHAYYMDTARQAQNPLTQSVFFSLAAQELIHIQRIKELYDGEPESAGVPSIAHGELEQAVKEIFDKFTSEQRQAWTMDNGAAYEYAMKLECDAAAMYDRLAHESINPGESQFFESLRSEENEHLATLENVAGYLGWTGEWFAEEEIRVWNWMNM